MTCPRCGVESRENVAFCEDCGARLERACPRCGAATVAGKRFCGACGAPLAGIAAERVPAPAAYTPRHLAAKILTARESLEGERKQVTVLFADLKGSMELLAERDPEEARKLLDPVITHMMDAVHRYEGTVNQVMGDGIMALFGAPLAHEDHAVRACFAALAMQEKISRYGDELQRTQGVPIQIRVGLNSGEVVVRSVGSDLRMDYTAVGPTTHLAARMEQIAKPGSALLTADTLRLAEGYVHVRALGPITVKGVDRPIDAFELTAAAAVRSRLQAAIKRGLSRFVGRSAELEHLRRIDARAEQGQGQVVAVVGDPGVGKSRLFYEFLRAPQTRRRLVLEASSVSYGKATSYLPVLSLLKSYFRIDEPDDTRGRIEKVTGKLLTLDRTLEDAIAPILALLEALTEDHVFHALDPSQRRRRTLEALRRLFLRESQVQPLVLVFEDLHWIDPETQALLDALVDALPAARILLLVNYRPEYQHGWGRKTYYSQLRIDPLAAEDSRELLDSLLGRDPALDQLKRFLAGRAEGNPLFLEETVRTLFETGVLDGVPGAYRLTRPVGELHVPATVQAILGARIDRLSPEHKRVLQAASVVGKDVPLAVLQAIVDVPDETLQPMLADLQASEFLYQASLFPDIEYTFKHALTHEVAYAGLLHDRRRALHGRIVEVMERLHPDRIGDHVDLLAHHALRGEAWPKVVRHARAAGVKAAGRAAYREAVALFDEALGALARLPEAPETREIAIDLRLDLRNALFPLGDLGRVADVLGEARALAETLGDTRRLGRACSYTAQHCWLTGDLRGAIAHGRRATEIAAVVADAPMRAATNLYVGEAYHALGAYREGLAILRDAVGALEDDSIRERFGQSSLLVHARSSLVWCLAGLGEFAEGLRRAEEVLRVARAVGRPFDLVTAHFALGQLLLSQGDVERAIEIFEPSVQLVREHNFRTWFTAQLASLGFLYAAAGRLSDGIALLEESVSARPAHFRSALVYLGHAYLWAGRRDEASALARRVIERAARNDERGHEAWALRLLGDSTRDDPSPAESERAYRAAMSIAEERGMRPLLAHCHAGLAELYRQTGNTEAERHAREAAALAEALGMRLRARAPGNR